MSRWRPSLHPKRSRWSSRAFVILALVVACAPAAALAQTTGEWTQYQGDAAHLGTSPEGPEPPYAERWRFAAPEDDALGRAVISDDLAYTLGREAVYALDLATGEVTWQVARDGRQLSTPALVTGRAPTLLFVDGPATQSSGGSTSPSPSATSSPSSTLSPSTDASDEASVSSVVALEAGTGDELWRTALEARSRTGVTVSGDTAFVGDDDGRVVALDASSGDIAWSRQVGAGIEVPLAADDTTVVGVTEDADGREVRVFALDAASGEPRFDPLVFRIGSTAASAPTIVDGTALIGLPDRLVHAISLEDGTELWSALTLTVFSPATSTASSEGDAYVADLGGGLYSLDASSGARHWSFQFNDLVVRSAPVRVGGSLLLGLGDGRLVAVDAETGRLVWQGRAPGLTGSIAVGGDVVVAVKGGRDAGLIAYASDPDGELLDVSSPTVLDVGGTLATAGIGGALALAIVLLPGLLLRRRSEREGVGRREALGDRDIDGTADDEDAS